jgi:hypothetical protein
MTHEPQRIKALFDQLIDAPLKDFPAFPAKYVNFDALYQPGVYVI